MGQSFIYDLMPFRVYFLTPFWFPMLRMCYTSRYSFPVTACVTICETDLWKKAAFEKFLFCVESVDNQPFLLHLSLVFKFQILVLVEIYTMHQATGVIFYFLFSLHQDIDINTLFQIEVTV